MNAIPEYNPPESVKLPEPQDYPPERINIMIEKEYKDYLEGSRIQAETARTTKRKEYDEMYKRLCDKFLDQLPLKEDVQLKVVHVYSEPTNRDCIKHACPTTYQMYAIQHFVNQLKKKNYNAFHREIVEYRNNPDKDDYYDYCDCYYVVEITVSDSFSKL